MVRAEILKITAIVIPYYSLDVTDSVSILNCVQTVIEAKDNWIL